MITEEKTDTDSPAGISIIVAIYNMNYIVERLFKSIKKSDYKNVEVIIVDDFSTDNVKPLVDRYGFKYLRLDKQSGAAKARNEGAKVAANDYFLFCDADIELMPNTLSLMMDRFSKLKIHTIEGYEILNPTPDNYIGTFRVLSIQEMLYSQGIATGEVNFWSTTCGSITREAFEASKGFDESFKGADVEDIEICFRTPKKYTMYHDLEINFKHHYMNTNMIHRAYLKRAYQVGRLNWPLGEHSFYSLVRIIGYSISVLLFISTCMIIVDHIFIAISILFLLFKIFFHRKFYMNGYKAKGFLFFLYSIVVANTIGMTSFIGFATGRTFSLLGIIKK